MINLPLLVREHCLGTLNIGSVQSGAPDPDDCKFLQQVATQIAYAIDHVLAYQQIKQLSEQLRRENEYLAEEVKASRNLRLVVGTSPSFTKIVDLVKTVAPTDTTVLLLGETGTGKEVLAQALHDLSTRSQKPFIRVNCAALPSGLIESELFGHERGAFTGAQLRRAGRFELAHSGTLFLDEIGEMPLETQAKLLRVLQDGMVDRIGGTQPVSVDVRLVAATNADLLTAIQQGTFRADLYYRLHIFPMAVPPLRERREDIHVLAQHFLAQIGSTLNRPHLTFDPQSMVQLLIYNWPGKRARTSECDRAGRYSVPFISGHSGPNAAPSLTNQCNPIRRSSREPGRPGAQSYRRDSGTDKMANLWRRRGGPSSGTQSRNIAQSPEKTWHSTPSSRSPEPSSLP